MTTAQTITLSGFSLRLATQERTFLTSSTSSIL